MFQFLQRNSSINFILLPLVVLLLWGTELMHPQFTFHYYDQSPMVLYKPLMALQNWSSFAGVLVSLLILTVNILLLMRVNSLLRLIEKRSTLYIFLFVVFSASLQDFKQLNPMQPALTFLILGFSSLFQMYKNEKDLKTIFESSLCFSIATLFYAPTLYFAVVVLIGLLILTPFYWRQWLSAIIGYSLPIGIVFALSYCFNSFPEQWAVWNANLFVKQDGSFKMLLPLCFSIYLGILFVCGVLYVFSDGIRKVSTRKYYSIFFVFMLLILSIYFFVPFVSYSMLFFGLLPAAMFISNYMVNIKRKFFAEILFELIIVFAVLVQVFPNMTI